MLYREIMAVFSVCTVSVSLVQTAGTDESDDIRCLLFSREGGLSLNIYGSL